MTKTSKKDFLSTLDQKLNEFADKCKFIKKVTDLKIIKDILKSKIMNDIDKKLKTSFDIMMKVFWVLWIISWVFWIISFFAIITSWYFFWPLFFRFLIMAVVLLTASLLSLVGWYWMFNFKKRVPAIVIVNFAFGLVSTLLFAMISLKYLSGNANNIVSFLISGFVMLLILKNKDRFIK